MGHGHAPIPTNSVLSENLYNIVWYMSRIKTWMITNTVRVIHGESNSNVFDKSWELKKENRWEPAVTVTLSVSVDP